MSWQQHGYSCPCGSGTVHVVSSRGRHPARWCRGQSPPCLWSTPLYQTTTKAHPAKAGAAKPRVLASFTTPLSTPRRTHDRRAAEGAAPVVLFVPLGRLRLHILTARRPYASFPPFQHRRASIASRKFLTELGHSPHCGAAPIVVQTEPQPFRAGVHRRRERRPEPRRSPCCHETAALIDAALSENGSTSVSQRQEVRDETRSTLRRSTWWSCCL